MKKVFVLCSLFCFLVQFSYAEEVSLSIEKPKQEYIITPFIGFAAIGVTTGFDFAYRHRNGFLLLCNVDLSIPISGRGGFLGGSELLFGYSIKRNNLYIGFSAGFWGEGGTSVQGYRLSYSHNPQGIVTTEYSPAFLAVFAVRNDYTYFFTEKVGIAASQTYGVGLHFGPWLTVDLMTTFSFMAKVGVAFKV